MSVKNQLCERAESQNQQDACSGGSPGGVFKANLQERKCFIFQMIVKGFHQGELITVDLSVVQELPDELPCFELLLAVHTCKVLCGVSS